MVSDPATETEPVGQSVATDPVVAIGPPAQYLLTVRFFGYKDVFVCGFVWGWFL
jgi:hypothetical protein